MSGALSGTAAVIFCSVLVRLVAVASVSQHCAPPAAWAGVCGGPCGCSSPCCGAVAGSLPGEGRTDCVEIGVAACRVATGSCVLDAVLPVRAWEGAAKDLDAGASAVSARALSAARRTCTVGGRMVGTCAPSVRGVLGRRWGLAVGYVCPRFLPLGPTWSLSVSSRKVTRRAAEGAVRFWLWAPADPLGPRCGFSVRHVGGSSVRALRVAGARHLSPGSLGRRRLALVSPGPVWGEWPPGTGGLDRQDAVSEQGLSDAEGRPVVPPPM